MFGGVERRHKDLKLGTLVSSSLGWATILVQKACQAFRCKMKWGVGWGLDSLWSSSKVDYKTRHMHRHFFFFSVNITGSFGPKLDKRPLDGYIQTWFGFKPAIPCVLVQDSSCDVINHFILKVSALVRVELTYLFLSCRLLFLQHFLSFCGLLFDIRLFSGLRLYCLGPLDWSACLDWYPSLTLASLNIP